MQLAAVRELINYPVLKILWFCVWPVWWFPKGLAQRPTFVLLFPLILSCFTSSSCMPTWSEGQQTQQVANRPKIPGRKRHRKKFLEGIRAQRCQSVSWRKWSTTGTPRTGHMQKKPEKILGLHLRWISGIHTIKKGRLRVVGDLAWH